jgi:Fur family ferric uptake transcriptional regulator
VIRASARRAIPVVTLSPPGTASAPRSVEAAVARVRARGLRASSARRLVLEALFAAGRPVAAEEIASGLEGRVPVSDLASVYRNLETLERIGVVRHVHPAHGRGLYALAREDSGYATCERCGEVRAVDAEALEPVRAAVRAALGYEASFGHFPIVGLCGSCAGIEGSGSTPPP